MAELWKLPVVYVIENNQYAMGTSVQRSSATTKLHMRGASFNIPGEEVDGMDVLAVRDAGLKAAAYARSGDGPYILEMKTYRYRGHSMSDPATYRTKEEVDEVKKTRDPIDHVRERLLKGKVGRRSRAQGHRQRGQEDRRRRRRIRPHLAGTRSSELRTDIYTAEGVSVMTDVLMPALSPTMEEGTLAKWQFKVGDAGILRRRDRRDRGPTRRPAWRRGRRRGHCSPRSWCRKASQEVEVHTPIARLNGEGDGGRLRRRPRRSPCSPSLPNPAGRRRPAPWGEQAAACRGDPESEARRR